MSIVVTFGHLGGYVEGGDPATRYPQLWDWLVDGPLAVRTVLDVGCGEGHALDHFLGRGCNAIGVDGVPQPHPRILQHDYAEAPFFPGVEFDLVWCCEFVEHLEERHLANALPSLTSGRHLLLTHAEPGQPGYHHVNCQPASYWRGVLAGHGLLLDERLTVFTRCLAGRELGAWNHYARSGLAFSRPEHVRPDAAY